jgi:hypothetical protein
MRTHGRRGQPASGRVLLWISGLFSLGGYALGIGAGYWRV